MLRTENGETQSLSATSSLSEENAKLGEKRNSREKREQHITQGNYLSVLHGAGIMKVLIKTAKAYITFNMCQVTILSHFHILIHLIFTTTL